MATKNTDSVYSREDALRFAEWLRDEVARMVARNRAADEKDGNRGGYFALGWDPNPLIDELIAGAKRFTEGRKEADRG